MRLAKLAPRLVNGLLVQVSVLVVLYVTAVVWVLVSGGVVQAYVPQLIILYAAFAILTVVFRRSVVEYLPLLLVLQFGMLVWTSVFNAAVADYLSGGVWNSRGVWLGNRPIDFFGYTIQLRLEGYTDYSFFYVHWGHNMLNGVMPYSDAFGYLVMNGITNRNGLYIFPPFYAYLYAAGIALPVDDWGIGLLIACFGYLTVLPVYGLGRELSANRHVGEVAALTYLLSPSVLYHTDFVWLNPSPFIFFFFAGFYMLVRGNRHTGTILILVSALFKQTAWFLGIPLVVYLLMKPRVASRANPPGNRSILGSVREILRGISNALDIRGFMFSVVLVVIFVGAVMFPFLLAQPYVLLFMSLASGGFRLESFTELPSYGSPARLQVLPLVAYLSIPESNRSEPLGVFLLWLTQTLDNLVFNDFLLILGVVIFSGVMLIEPRRVGREKQYMRRLLFLTMIMMLWVNLTGPRGVYKYYFTLFAPFFSLFSSARIVESKEEHVPFSWSMLWLPVSMSAMILIPSRYVYLFGVLLIMIAYLLVHSVGTFWYILTTPTRYMSDRLKGHMHHTAFLASVLASKVRGLNRETSPLSETLPDSEAMRESEGRGGMSNVGKP
ncbi:MAG: hypothetical protein C4K47_05960 [Candidatus Thorarchaeota archaeon]|nr:MAG: hypothetical protein C4K47_05960 [Candidatus Thorarchaeota archaeon]